MSQAVLKSTIALATAVLCTVLTTDRAAAHDPSESKNANRPRIEICFVLDTTGSMGGLIQGAKDKIWSIANEMAKAKPAPDIRFGLIGYRDRGDAYVTQATSMTTDLDEIFTKLTAFQAAGGGDGPESVNQALLESVQTMQWSDDDSVLKIIFLVGDAPPHMDYDETKYPKICKRARKQGLIINTIQCGSIAGTKEVWTDIAQNASGEFAAILQSGGTVAIQTPFDADISRLNVQLNGTVCVYGCPEEQDFAQSKFSSQSIAKAESIADRATFFNNMRATSGAEGGSYNVISGTDDLVEMILESKIELTDVDADKLPKDLKAMTEAERAAEINKRIERRKTTQSEIDSLIKKRQSFIADKKSKATPASKLDSFDEQVKTMLHEQAAAKGIRYTEEK